MSRKQNADNTNDPASTANPHPGPTAATIPREERAITIDRCWSDAADGIAAWRNSNRHRLWRQVTGKRAWRTRRTPRCTAPRTARMNHVAPSPSTSTAVNRLTGRAEKRNR